MGLTMFSALSDEHSQGRLPVSCWETESATTAMEDGVGRTDTNL